MDVATSGAAKGSSLRLSELEAEARYARERHQLYRAKAYGPRLTSAGRLRELERASTLAQRRLERAKADRSQVASDGTSGVSASRSAVKSRPLYPRHLGAT